MESRVFSEKDFENVNYKEFGVRKKDFEDYKKHMIGRPVPPQTVSDQHLLELGYSMPDPWVQSCIELHLGNWG